MSALDKFLTLCRERESKATKGPWTPGLISEGLRLALTRTNYSKEVAAAIFDGQLERDAEFIASARTAQPALVEMVEKFQEYLSTDFCICDSDQEYKCDFCELNAAIDLLAEQALREMGQ